MEAYLIENEGVLALDADTFSNVEIVEAQLTLKGGGKAKDGDGDGRIDVLATYSQEYIAVVELKIGQLEIHHLTQLEAYLKQKNQILNEFPNILDKSLIASPKWIGILVGSSIAADLASKLSTGYKTDTDIPVAALTIQRFRGKDGNVYVTTDTFFSKQTSLKDTTKYAFDGEELGKGRLVLAVLKRHVETHPNSSYAELEKAFPKECQGSWGVFATIERANDIYAKKPFRRRHFLKPEELIKLSDDCTIAISSQWGIENIGKFISQAKKCGYSIKASG